MADRGFQRPQPPSHGRLRLTEAARGRAERTCTGDREKDFEVTPFHFAPKQNCMKIVQDYLYQYRKERGRMVEHFSRRETS
jgi:hypothetical protein